MELQRSAVRDEAMRIAQRRRIRWLWLVAVLVIPLGAIAAPRLSDGTALHELLHYSGVLLVVSAVLGRTWCALYIGGKKFGRLVTEGPYSVVRNPLYVFSCMGAFGIGLSTSSVTLAILDVVIVGIVLRLITGTEEKALLDRFGDDYRSYRTQVPRFVPSLRLWREAPQLIVEPSVVSKTFLESSWMTLAIPLIEVIELLRQSGWLAPVLVLP